MKSICLCLFAASFHAKRERERIVYVHQRARRQNAMWTPDILFITAEKNRIHRHKDLVAVLGGVSLTTTCVPRTIHNISLFSPPSYIGARMMSPKYWTGLIQEKQSESETE